MFMYIQVTLKIESDVEVSVATHKVINMEAGISMALYCTIMKNFLFPKH